MTWRTVDYCDNKWDYWRPRVLAAAAAKPRWTIVPGESVGPLKLGMTADEVLQAIGPAPPESFGEWEYPTLGLNVTIERGRVVSMCSGGGSCGDPWRVLGKAFPGEFAPGVGMGSTSQEVVAVIGEPLGPGYTAENIEWLIYHNMDLIFENGRLGWMNLCLPREATTSACEGKWDYWRPRILAAAATKARWTIVPGESVGPLKLDMTVEEVLQAIGPTPPESFGEWEYPTLGLNVGFSGGRVVSVNSGGSSCGDPEDLLVKAFPGELAPGVGMGSTRQELVAVLGEPLRPGLKHDEQERMVYRNMDLFLKDGCLVWMTILLPDEE